ncbi:hypothetical protein PVK06_023710 [Gossypium arboreum]|uniref:Reverse transcriptase zinc-binding domain-containing protein n=1 Tax=Gossypium arboreum TaxID=29729 RepID=A0ABR0PC47_GOSAR|nr:hypothetical protein PVK06_023710 [Gossypium arboreum]
MITVKFWYNKSRAGDERRGSDGAAIRKIPIGSASSRDRLLRHFTKSGDYEIRSSYRFLCDEENVIERNSPSTSLDCSAASKNLAKLWKLQLAPKVKTFIWRTCHNAVATKKNLAERTKHKD